MINLQNISLSFGSQKIFDGINLTIAPSDRLGLVGRNGTGKSTLLKAIAQGNMLDSGTILVSGTCNVAYMPQEVVLSSTQSILEEALSAYKLVGPLRQRALALEPLIAQSNAQATEEYGDIMEQLAQLQLDHAIRDTKKVLQGLGFKPGQLDDSVTTLSVGWQMRVVLAKLLLQKADFYLFDEPTNHLDIIAKDWFLEFLQKADFGFLLVSHDRYFLDQLCTEIFELDGGKGVLYQGNYEDYEQEKQANLERLEKAFVQQQKEIKKKELFVERFKAKASKAKLAKSMERTLDKIERIELPPSSKEVRFNFANTERAGRIVLEVHDLSYAFDQKTIFKNVTFSIERGQKVAVIAPNGAGKTTLFNLLCGKYKLQHGKISTGYNVKTAIFEQEQHKVLDPKKSVLEEVMDNTAHKTEQQIRTFLGSFLFSKNEVVKKTKVLSGGERNRVSMVKVLLQDANFLLLDEPTNHLDIQSKEVLYQALSQFDGTVLFVSHDHDFVNKLATRVLELTHNGVHSYFGNYDSYLQQKVDQQEEHKQSEAGVFQNTKKQTDAGTKEDQEKDRKKETHNLERLIAKLEAEIDKLNASFGDLEYGTPEFSTTQEKVLKKEAELKKLLQQWESLQKNLKSQ